MLNALCFCGQVVCRAISVAQPAYFSIFRQYHRALIAVLLSRTWHVRRQAHQTVRKLLSSLGGYKLAYGLLEELKVVLSSHKVSSQEASSLLSCLCAAHQLHTLGLLLTLTYSVLGKGFSSSFVIF